LTGRRGLLPGVSGVLKRDPLDREKLLAFVDIEKRNSMAKEFNISEFSESKKRDLSAVYAGHKKREIRQIRHLKKREVRIPI